MKIGDRVVGVGEHNGKDIDGKTGTIVDYMTPFYLVEFDENIDGHYGHGWYVDEEHLRKERKK